LSIQISGHAATPPLRLHTPLLYFKNKGHHLWLEHTIWAIVAIVPVHLPSRFLVNQPNIAARLQILNRQTFKALPAEKLPINEVN